MTLLLQQKYKQTISRILPLPGMLLPFMLLVTVAMAQTGIGALPGAVTLQANRTSLDEVLEQLDKQTAYDFSYDKQAARNVHISRASFKNAPLGKVLQALLQEATLAYDIDRRHISVRVIKAARPTPPPQKKPGRISGRIIDEKGEALPGATIRIIELNSGAQSGVDGSYALEAAPGVYTMEVRFISYQGRRITGVTVKEEQHTPLDIALKPSSTSLREVVVTADYRQASIEGMFARQKNSAATIDGIVREQILRTPDNNVAQVLNRVSGLNVQDNRFVIVRGLSDRYNNVQLNGSLLPSTEPNARNFAFDIIPSALIDNVVVYKTATPDLPGEFSGGVVDMTTRDIPVENFVRLKVGTGFNTKATGKDFFGPARGKYDYLGFDDGGRQLPGGYHAGEYAKWAALGYNEGDTKYGKLYGDMSARFPNRFTMYRFAGRPLQDYELNVGRVKERANGNRLGGLLAITYRNQQTVEDYIDHAPIQIHYYEGKEYTFDTNLSGLLNLGYSFGRNRLALKNIFTQKFTERSRLYKGQNLYSDVFLDGYANFPLFNTILQSKLEGEHAIGQQGFKLSWSGGLSLTRRREPDNKRFAGEKAPGASIFSYLFNDGNQLRTSSYFSDLKEHRYTWNLDAQQPFRALGRQQLLKIGYQGTYRDADFEAERFSIRPDANNTALQGKMTGLPYYEVYAPANFGQGKIIYYPMLASQNQDRGRNNGYIGNQQLHAAYLMLDGHIAPRLRFAGGLRMEHNHMSTVTLDSRAKPDGTVTNHDTTLAINKTDWLPSVNLIYELSSRFNIRASYYHSVARPDLRELSFFEYYKPEESVYVSGNDLKPTGIRNADLRFEFYPTPQELISLSGFYKRFNNPIELQLDASLIPSHVLAMRYMNMKQATDFGLELNFRKSLGFVSERSAFLQQLFVSGNFTYLNATVEFDSEVRIRIGDGKEVVQPAKRSRPLFGQAPYIVNGGLMYTGRHFGFNAVYNRVGERIVYGSELDEYNEYEKPRDVIDLQVNLRFLKNNRAEIKLNAADILNQPVVRYYNNHRNIWKPNAAGVPGSYDQYGNLIIPRDPSGKKYDGRYDELRRKFWMGRNFTMSFSYTF